MNDLFDLLLNERLLDIVLLGIVDLDCDPVEFLPFLDRVYLKIGEHLIELARPPYEAHMHIAAVPAARFERSLEETHRVCLSSVGTYVLMNPLADNRVVSITMYSEDEDAILALEVETASGQTLFFDPSFIDGINFGGAEQKNLWLENSLRHSRTRYVPRLKE